MNAEIPHFDIYAEKLKKKWKKITATGLLIYLHITAVNFVKNNDFDLSRLPMTDTISEIIPGKLIYERKILSNPNNAIHTLTIPDMSLIDILLNYDRQNGNGIKAQTALRFINSNKTVSAVVNGSFFTPYYGGFSGIGSYPQIGDEINIEGQFRYKNIEISGPKSGYGVFCINENGLANIYDYSCLENDSVGIAGKEILLSDGKIQANLDNTKRHPRSAVGINGNQVVFIVIDGRLPGYSEGVTLYELAQILKDMDMISALVLDGGGSSNIVLRMQDGRVIIANSPVNRILNLRSLRPGVPVGLAARK